MLSSSHLALDKEREADAVEQCIDLDRCLRGREQDAFSAFARRPETSKDTVTMTMTHSERGHQHGRTPGPADISDEVMTTEKRLC